MTRKQLFICDLIQRREIGSLHRNEKHQLTEASTGLADKLLVHNNVIKVMPILSFSFPFGSLVNLTVEICFYVLDELFDYIGMYGFNRC